MKDEGRRTKVPCLFRYGYRYCAVCQLGGELVASLKSLGTFLHLPRFAQQAVSQPIDTLGVEGLHPLTQHRDAAILPKQHHPQAARQPLRSLLHAVLTK